MGLFGRKNNNENENRRVLPQPEALVQVNVIPWISKQAGGKIYIRDEYGVAIHSKQELKNMIGYLHNFIDSGRYNKEECAEFQRQIRVYEYGLTL